MSDANFHVAVSASEGEARRLAAELGGEIDREVSAYTPRGVQALSFERPIPPGVGLPEVGQELARELTELGAGPDAVVGYDVDPAQGGTAVGRTWVQTMNLLGTGTLPGLIHTTMPATPLGRSAEPSTSSDGGQPPGSNVPPPPGTTSTGTTSTGAEKPPETKPAVSAEAEKSASADGCCTANEITAAVAGLSDPAQAWAWAEDGDRGALARQLLPGLYESRALLTEKATFAFAPELVLLEKAAAAQRERLAEDLLRVRSEMTNADNAIRNSKAKLAAHQAELTATEVQLGEKQVELAGKGVSLAQEAIEHMKRWRELSKTGVRYLFASTVFSMLAIGYLLLKLIPDGDIGEVAAPIIIFVLAIFAVSPAVLLLIERPLDGLDKWSPGGGAESASGESGDKEPSGEDPPAPTPAAVGSA